MDRQTVSYRVMFQGEKKREEDRIDNRKTGNMADGLKIKVSCILDATGVSQQ